MAARGKGWLIGLLVATVATGLLRQDEATRPISTAVGLLVLASVGLIVEMIVARSRVHERPDRGTPRDLRPADGVVEVVKVSGVEGQPNQVDPAFRRFLPKGGDIQDLEARPRDPTTPALLGRVVLVSVFVGRDDRAWTDAEIARGHLALRVAGRWIESEASRRHAPVNIGLADVYFQVNDESDEGVEIDFVPLEWDVAPMEANATTRYLTDASRAASTLGFADASTMMGWVNSRIDADATAWIFHQKRSGCSLAISSSESSLPGVGMAVCFAREASFPERLSGPARVDPVSVAHEVLHLFGATDKYGVSLDRYATGQVSSRDIMRLDHQSLGRMRVDPLTAAELGWTVADQPRKKARREP